MFFRRNDSKTPPYMLILFGEIPCRSETCRNGGHGENVPLRAAVGKTIQLCKESFIITI